VQLTSLHDAFCVPYTSSMLQLAPHECRVLGVLVEKAQTTPQQYPLSLNALTNGCNQKNNREPVTNLSEEQVLIAIDGLRAKGVVREVMLSGSRVQKFRHVTREVIDVDTNQLIVLTELLLRGPQTLGELRGRASRMHPLETTEIDKNIIDSLINRPEPLVKELPPLPGDRAVRYAQLLCPTLHPLDAPPSQAYASPAPAASTAGADVLARVEQLEREVSQLKSSLRQLAQSAGRSDLMQAADD
jgi:uncharacterized protein YceH (UPF0502 family)